MRTSLPGGTCATDEAAARIDPLWRSWAGAHGSHAVAAALTAMRERAAGQGRPVRARQARVVQGAPAESASSSVLGRNGGGGLVNGLSALSWHALPQIGSYGVSKAAAWSMTNAVREELRAQGTLTVAVHAAFIDTDMAGHVDQPKISPADVVGQVLDAVEADREEVLADAVTGRIKTMLSALSAGANHDH
ncbi:SDR family NAD(P)-dependent oxidoreductase [Streptomyces sp. NPDC057963]|uniref:SDR family NAD(P)-dependent oxidoreductase n=1 Tax=Streptomyces sp. NPDC057963 TaxID=3346290 RepID=UPI0036E7A55D